MIKNKFQIFKVSPAEKHVIDSSQVNVSKISRDAVLKAAMKTLKENPELLHVTTTPKKGKRRKATTTKRRLNGVKKC